MASRTKKSSSASAVTAPVTFDLPEDLLARLERSRLAAGLRTTSEIVRVAIDGFDFEACTPRVEEVHRQISVRLNSQQRATLKRTATRKGMSIGELLRLAVEAMPEPKKGAAARVASKAPAASAKKKAAKPANAPRNAPKKGAAKSGKAAAKSRAKR